MKKVKKIAPELVANIFWCCNQEGREEKYRLFKSRQLQQDQKKKNKNERQAEFMSKQNTEG